LCYSSDTSDFCIGSQLTSGKSVLLLAAVICAIAAQSRAAADFWRLDTWTTEDGLPSNEVVYAAQTPDGYLWLTTRQGLVRFDGNRFTVFRAEDTPGISSNWMNWAYVDAMGTLWIGTPTSGIIRYRNGRFDSLTKREGLVDNNVRRIMADDHGRLVVLARRVFYWDGGRFQLDRTEDYRTPGTRAFLDQFGHVWHADSSGLYKVSESGRQRLPIHEADLGKAQLFVRPDASGGVWVAIVDRGLHYIQGNVDRFFGAKDGLTDRKIRDFYFDKSGELWITTQDKLFLGVNGRFSEIASLPDAPKVHAYMFRDRDGLLWITGSGLHLLRPRFITNLTTQDGLASDNVYPIFEDHAGAIWLGSWPGLNRISGSRVEHVELPVEGARQLVASLAEDAQGTIWIGTYGESVLCFRNGHVTRFAPADQLHVNGILAILPSRTGTVWFGTTTGLYAYKGGAMETPISELRSERIDALHESSDGTLWIGSMNGLISWKPGVLRRYTRQDGLAGNQVVSLYEDAEKTLWVGSYSGGITRVRSGVLKAIHEADGLADSSAFRILEDNQGQFWVSGSRGIYSVSKRQLNEFAEGHSEEIISALYGKPDGLLDPTCNNGVQPAGVKIRSGELWFPTQHGVAIVHPERLTGGPPPSVMIEDVMVGRQPVPFARGLRFPSETDEVQIDYTGIDFLAPDTLRFRYYLEGLDRNWIDAGTDRIAVYTHVPPGSYTFHVMAANRDGIWSRQGAQLAVTVIPPFWRTPIFLVFAGLAAISAGLLAVGIYDRARIRVMRRKQESVEAFSRSLLASQESERKRIAAELHDSLGQHLLVIKNQALLAIRDGTVKEQLDERLTEISATASQALEEVRTIAHDLRPYALDRMELSRAIESMVRRVSHSTGIPFETALASVAGIFSKDTELGLYRIAQEAINNVVRHSEATRARVELRHGNGEVELVISDNGKGLADHGDGTSSAQGNGNGSGGSGLRGLSERARLIGGVAAIECIPGAGTTIAVKIRHKGGYGGEQNNRSGGG
jgi:signal transduction histidine kinase/ligand-binding sensor domain-containing protein